ncbi:subtilisin-like protease SBT4.11 [Camellia sinensis]|uniref:subtilisin-like protease SBT4.11 n=1 Tax=Camellia sinensis TaxID=4442 RepID=UPI001035C404|nr:subtilisin-like protease SBT4.11 [Camellia sinensis]
MELQEVHYPLPGLLPTKTVIQTLAAKILTYSLPLTTPSADGIDVISISLGQENALDITIDSLSIGSLHAMERGVLTVHSAGNTGLSTVRAPVTSVAPWLLSVAASIIDCRIINRVVLGGWKDSATCMYLQHVKFFFISHCEISQLYNVGFVSNRVMRLMGSI